MPSTFFGLNIADSGIRTYQAAINTTANNISNVQTEGYSRQSTVREATAPLRVYAKYGSAGTGVQVTSIIQERNLYYDTKYWENNCDLGYFDQKLYYLSQIETVFTDDVAQQGFATIFSKMFNGLDTLNGGNASDESVRNQFINLAQTFCTYFNSVSDSLKELQKDTNEEIASTVSRINSISEEISLINKEINHLEMTGGYANELRDRRALLVDELSTMVSVTTSEYEVRNTYGQNLGGTNYTVSINGQLLVDGTEYRQLECVSAEYKNNQTDAEGLYDIVWADTKGDFAATTKTASGTLKALFDLRDGNNNEAMMGTCQANQDENGDYTSLTITNLSNTNVNALAIPPEGTVKVNNTTVVYTSWEAQLDADGNIESITFAMQEPIDPEKAPTFNDRSLIVGDNVDAMGVPYYMQQMNEFLRNFTEMFNDIQHKGMTLDGEAMGSFFVAETPTGVLYDFDEENTLSSTSDGYHQLTALNAVINSKSLDDPGYFATTVDITNGEDAYDLLEEMMKLQEDVIVFRGNNAGAFLETLLSDISVDTEKTTIFQKNYSNMETVINNQRMSVSGVDEDEEALNLVKFQNAYNLSAKVVSVMAEIYNKLINETGVT